MYVCRYIKDLVSTSTFVNEKQKCKDKCETNEMLLLLFFFNVGII